LALSAARSSTHKLFPVDVMSMVKALRVGDAWQADGRAAQSRIINAINRPIDGAHLDAMAVRLISGTWVLSSVTVSAMRAQSMASASMRRAWAEAAVAAGRYDFGPRSYDSADDRECGVLSVINCTGHEAPCCRLPSPYHVNQLSQRNDLIAICTQCLNL